MKQTLQNPTTIAIDGPAASGKSSVGSKLAAHFGYLFLDTGIMYRAVTLAALHKGIDLDDEAEVGQLAETIRINIQKPTINDGRQKDILVNGLDVTNQLRTKAVNDFVSQVSRYARVRQAMTEQQREIARKRDIVMAGRDIGTVVLPNADLKIYLKASSDERAHRRYSEEIEKGKSVVFEDILKNVKMRDEIDSTRKIAPLKPADDAHIIITDGKDIDQVTDEILDLVNTKRPLSKHD